jgi:hypothetical protein
MQSVRIWRTMRGAAAILAVLFALATVAQGLALESQLLRLEVDDETGRIVALSNPAGFNLVDASVITPLWIADLNQPGQAPLGPDDAGEFEAVQVETDPPALRMVWSDFGLETAPDLHVVVEASLDAGTASSWWSIALEGLDELRPSSVRFPRLGSFARQESEALAVPVWMGEITAKPRELLNRDGAGQRLEWTYPGILSMQCVTLYGNQGLGFYAACDDTSAYGKRLAFFGNGKGAVSFEAVQLPANAREPGDVYRSPYRVALGLIKGDWFTAAQRYRTWALRQPWATNSRLRTGATPQWVLDAGLWVWNRGRSEEVLEPAEVLQETANIPVSVFWHWWHGCAYDVGFPEYFPPREGSESFKAAVSKAQAKGLHAIVYMNQRLWGMTTESWEKQGAARYAVKGPDGAIHPEIYNTFTQSPCASMCMGTAFWRDTYAGLAAKAVLDYGVDGVYMDQACSSLSCYDPNHGHPVGGGVYWIQGFQSLQQDIRSRCQSRDPAVALAGEGCGEAWLPYLDLMLSLQVSMERYAAPGDWRPIPFFHAVYHGYCIPFGNYASLTMPPYDELWPKETAPECPLALLDRKFSMQFRLEQARAFAWGQTPSLANFRPEQLESRRAEVDFLVRLARLRQRANAYLLHGTMLRPPRMDIPEATMPISRLSIYAGQQGGLTEYEERRPLMVSSAWQSPGGGVAVVVVNIADGPQRVGFTLDSRNWPIPVHGVVRILQDEGSETQAAYSGGKAIVEEDLPPTGTRVYLFEDP